jgi:hypothetical protein
LRQTTRHLRRGLWPAGCLSRRPSSSILLGEPELVGMLAKPNDQGLLHRLSGSEDWIGRDGFPRFIAATSTPAALAAKAATLNLEMLPNERKRGPNVKTGILSTSSLKRLVTALLPVGECVVNYLLAEFIARTFRAAGWIAALAGLPWSQEVPVGRWRRPCRASSD